MIIPAALVTLLALGGVTASPSLQLSLSGATSVTDVDNFKVVATLKNTGDEAINLYTDPRSALSSFPENTFTVSSKDGSRAGFIGAKVKYGFGAATDLVSLEPGASIDVTHNLAAAYNFTQTGDYEIEVANLFHYQDASGNVASIRADVQSNYEARLKGNLVSSIVAKRSLEHGLAKRASFTSCSSTQSSQINTALTTTTTYLTNSVNYLNNLSASSTRWKTWFGTYSSSRKSTVLSHYTKVQSSNPTTYTYDCSLTNCGSGTYAYVYPNQFGLVYLCSAFWSAPTAGTDSKAGTIVHESTHFTSNGGTGDYAYGQSAAKSLATSNPSQAIMNADSHEYFAENTPALS